MKPADRAAQAAEMMESITDVQVIGFNRPGHRPPVMLPLPHPDSLRPDDLPPEWQLVAQFPADSVTFRTDRYGDLVVSMTISQFHKYDALPVTDYPSDRIHIVAYAVPREEQ